jgi:hypothetical protein
MKCRDAREKLLAYADDDLPADERAAIEAHLEACADCRAEAAGLRRTEDALRALAAVERAPEVTADLRSRLAVRPVHHFPWVLAGAAVAAAAALLFLWPHPRVPRPEPRSRGAQAVVRVPVAEPLAQPAVESKMKPAAPPRRRPLRHRIARRAPPRPRPPVEAPKPEPAAPEAAAAEPPEGGTPEIPAGVILVLGAAEEPLSPSSCYVEVSMPDGRKSILQRDVEVDATGQPAALRLAYENIEPGTRARKEGG